MNVHSTLLTLRTPNRFYDVTYGGYHPYSDYCRRLRIIWLVTHRCKFSENCILLTHWKYYTIKPEVDIKDGGLHIGLLLKHMYFSLFTCRHHSNTI